MERDEKKHQNGYGKTFEDFRGREKPFTRRDKFINLLGRVGWAGKGRPTKEPRVREKARVYSRGEGGRSGLVFIPQKKWPEEKRT